MNPNLVEIAFVMDRSGSMEPMKSEAIGGFNHFIEEQKKEPGDARFTLILFDHEYLKPIDHQPLSEVAPIDPGIYQPRGTTALLDAMGQTIDDIGRRLGDTPENERPSKVIIACMTDGFENASKRYSNADISRMIEHQRTKYSWEFVFLGATIESRVMAESWTIASSDVLGFKADGAGVTQALSRKLRRMVSEKRQSN